MMSEVLKTPNVKKVSMSPVVIPPSPAMKKLGYGTGVEVYRIERYSPLKGCYKSPWAVKKINRKCGKNSEFEKRLLEEARVLKQLKHPNIIGYRSCTVTKEGAACLMMEDGHQSLSHLIEHRVEGNLHAFPASQILVVIKDIASALHYLHTDKYLLHGDLKSANILIKKDFLTAKLCDFGVTLKLNNKHELLDDKLCYIGTECWSAPEVVHEGVISNKTDMFSYGLVIWEMLSLNAPHLDKLEFIEGVNDTSFELELKEAESEQLYIKHLGTRPALPDYKFDGKYNIILEIFYACTEEKAKDRPSAGLVLTLVH